ncbi:F-box only protein 38, partial [Stegodyphus mimosarum]
MLQIQDSPNLTDLSHELLCQILKYLPLKEVLALSTLCKKLSAAVGMHLRLCKSIDFCQDKIYGYMPASITDDHMHSLLKKCPHLETVYGLHPLKVERRRLRKRSALTVPGIIEALCLCYNLKAIETCDLKLLEAVMQVLPQLEIIGNFRNRDGVFPPHASQRLKLQPYPRISSLHLIGVEVPELTAMPHLQHLHLQCVRFTKLQPFRAFLAQNLKTFVMKHCMGPSVSLRYLSLIIALSSSPSLSRLELVRVPLPGGLFQRAVEDSYRHNGFVNLKTLVIAGCKGVLESDLGHLMIVASKNLESLFIQPSLTKDSLFVSLSFAQCEFPKLKNLHLGYVDKLNSSGEWSNDVLLTLGLAEVPDTPSSLTDSGMRVISELFPRIRTMSVSNCPHLMAMDQWSPVEGVQAWKELTDLTLQKCHCLQLPSFALFLALLPKIEVVILNDMFREPPKGCSHVGLSAGTGLGMSSAVVSNQDEHIAVQGHQQDFEPQGDEQLLENDEIDRDYVEADNEIRPEPHLMVLPQDFFDEQNNVVHVPVEIRENINDEIIVADDNGNNLNPVQIPASSVNYHDHQVQEETTDDDSETDDDYDDGGDGTVASPSVTQNKASSAFIKQEVEDEDEDDYAPSTKEIMQTVERIKREISEYDYLQPSTSSQNPCCVKIENKKDECKKISEVPGANLNNAKQSKCEKQMNELSEGTARSHHPSSVELNVNSVDSGNHMPSYSE